MPAFLVAFKLFLCPLWVKNGHSVNEPEWPRGEPGLGQRGNYSDAPKQGPVLDRLGLWSLI